MERLTKRTENGDAYFRKCCFDDGALDDGMVASRLAELEDKFEKLESVKLSFENIETLKLLTCASICYAQIKQEIENRMKDSKDIADLYFNIPTVQYSTFDFALSALSESNLDCNKINGFADILNSMPNFKDYLKRIKGE